MLRARHRITVSIWIFAVCFAASNTPATLAAGRNHTASTGPAGVPEPGGATVARSGVLEPGAPVSVTVGGETRARPCNTNLLTTHGSRTESNANTRADATASETGTTAAVGGNTALGTSTTDIGASNTALRTSTTAPRGGDTAPRSGITAPGAAVLLAESAVTPLRSAEMPQPNVVMPLCSAVMPPCLSVMPLRLPVMPTCPAATPAAKIDQFGADACCHFVPPSMVLKTPRKVPA